MKKILAFIFAVTLTAAAVGCEKIQDVANNSQANVSPSSEDSADDENEMKDNEKDDDRDSKVTKKKNNKKEYNTTTNKKDDINADSDSSRSENDSGSDNSNNYSGYDDDSGNDEFSAYAMYQSAVKMYGNILRGCPYELDYDDTDDNGFAAVSDSEVSGTDDIVSRYCTVFAEPDSYIYEKYIEKDGKVYYNDSSRGKNVYYTGTDLEYVSGDESNMTFNAVSHYRDPDTGEAMDDRTAVFSVEMTDEGYKVTEFSYPQ